MAISKHYHNPIANPQPMPRAAQHQAATTTIIIPTAANSPTLRSVIDTHKRQTEPTETILIDTSDTTNSHPEWLNTFKHADRPRHMTIKPKLGSHPCRIITEAIDAAIAIANTEWLFLTHDDVWLERRCLIEHMIALAEQFTTPIVGYEMSPRSHITEEWRGMVSHTATLLHAPTIQGLGLRWSLAAAHEETQWSKEAPGWPDTETNFGRSIKRLGIVPHFIGRETNDRHFSDENITHRRSLTSHRLHPKLGMIDDQSWIDAQIIQHASL
jgi:hypothetical protein